MSSFTTRELPASPLFKGAPIVIYRAHGCDLFGGLAPHQQRVILEHAELVDRIDKLEAFLDTPTYSALPVMDRDLLGYQLDAMQDYRSVLGSRIRRFDPTTKDAL